MFKAIVIGTDGSETARRAVGDAVALAESIGAKLLVVSVYEAVSDVRLREERDDVAEDTDWVFNRRDDVLAMLEETAGEARSAGVPEVETFARQGDPADAILDVAEEQQADLIMVGNRGMTGKRRFLLGSVPNKISHNAPCSVLIVKTT
ncbi:MAG TPA: universal stress protein [Solirubrobacteraceae bacterium]|jgi:nucleotide-binding universal stress UspA family protein|nr:universal stress protein [Solirubrobacteraceae bacterium]